MKQRLQKILSSRGVCSRRKAEELIVAGLVTVNGQRAVLGTQADPDEDEITVSGKALPGRSDFVYIMLHKPRGVVTTLDDEHGRTNASQMVSDCGCRVWPIGRLDMDSEGLLLFTNDGEFSQAVAHPRREIEKRYQVLVRNYSPEKAELLKSRVTLDGYTIAEPKVKVLKEAGDRAILEVIIHEGRNRQVRRMCAIAGLEVRRLMRVGEGDVYLGDLAPGTWRHLTADEIESLRRDGGV